MGYFGKLDLKIHAQKLRQQGYSYQEILREIDVSKDTISRWCKDIVLSKKQTLRLMHNKKIGQKKGSLIAAENKRKLRQEKVQKAVSKSKQDVGELTQRDKFLVGIALYAAEGNKTDNQGGFANSDPKLIKFMMDWFREYCQIPETRFRGAIWLHEGLNEAKSQMFWSQLTGIPEVNFYKTYIVKNKVGSHKIRKNIHEFGVFSVRFSHTEIHRQILGWIYALFDDKIATVH